MYGAPDGGHVLSKEQKTVPSDGQSPAFDTLIVILIVPNCGTLSLSSSQDVKNAMEHNAKNKMYFLRLFTFFPFLIYCVADNNKEKKISQVVLRYNLNKAIILSEN